MTRWLAGIGQEIFGLFVDDGRYAATILIWLLLAGVLLPRVLSGGWGGVVLFAGLAAILVQSAARRSRR